MKRILPAAALAVLMSTTSFAATDLEQLQTYKADQQQAVIYASEFIGMRVYATETDVDENGYVAGGEREWDDIGEVNDVILGHDGSVRAVILGVGGFLGVGEKDVAVSMDAIKMVRERDDADDFFLVIKANQQTLTDAEPYERFADERADEDTMQQQAEVTTESQQETANEAARERVQLVAPDVERDGYRTAEPAELTSDALVGARVYGAGDEDVGEVSELILSENDGSVEKMLIDVGGFLGIGEHTIAVGMDEVNIIRADEGDDWRVYIDSTQEALESQPEYEG